VSLVIVVFPSSTQRRVLAELAPLASHDVILVLPEGEGPPDVELPAVDAGSFRRRPALPNERWLCCNEHAVYFVGRYRDRVRALPFHARCLDMLTKLDMAAALRDAGVRVLPKTALRRESSVALSFPVVAKPNLGFASILVRRVESDASLRAYVADYDAARRASPVTWFQERYFDLVPDESLAQIILEPEVRDSTFISASLVVSKGRLEAQYLAEGVGCETSPTSDFQWRRFRAPARVGLAMREAIAAEMQKIARAFALDRAVFEAEMLVNERTGDVWVLEFSPRIVGGFIPELLLHATGVDLERVALAFALDLPVSLDQRADQECLLLNRDAPCPSLEHRLISSQERAFGGRHIVDEVYALA
jgi:biotin carboxylase